MTLEQSNVVGILRRRGDGDRVAQLAAHFIEQLADAEQQLEVLRPGGLYAWKWKYETLRGALEDICTADETSTLAGAVAIARQALQAVDMTEKEKGEEPHV
jgi:hypothetical protein